MAIVVGCPEPALYFPGRCWILMEAIAAFVGFRRALEWPAEGGGEQERNIRYQSVVRFGEVEPNRGETGAK